MIAHNLIDVPALVARTEARVETRCEATSNLSESKKKEVCNLEKPTERIINEDIDKILIQLVGVVMDVGYLLKCLIVVIVFFGFVLVEKN